jgi:hypothetical protein
MKKASNRKDTLRSEYTPSDFPGGMVRGKYAKKAEVASNFVVLDPEVAAAFPSSASVNDALRALVKVAKRIKPAA